MTTWQLDDIYREVILLADPTTALQYKQREGMTAYGNAAPLTVKQDPSEADLAGKTYVFRGGRIHTTTDPVIRQLWLDSGFGVTVTVP